MPVAGVCRLHMLPVNYAGLLLILFGLMLLRTRHQSDELRTVDRGRSGEPAVRVDNSDGFASPELQVKLRVVLPVVLGFAGIAMFLVRLGVAARRHSAATGRPA